MKYIVCLLSLLMLGTVSCRTHASSRQSLLNQRLIAAIKQSNLPAVKSLLVQEANPNAHEQRSRKRLTKRLLAIEVKTPSALLLALGVRAADDPDKWTAKKNADIINVLVEAGANVNEAEQDKGLTPLMLAVIGNGRGGEDEMTPQQRMAVVKGLLRHGASIHARAKKDTTALMGAVLFPHREQVIRLLLEHGADPNAMSDTGDRPLTLVRQANYIPLLVQHGANINAVDKTGQTVLSRVKKEQSQIGGATDEIVNALRKQGATE